MRPPRRSTLAVLLAAMPLVARAQTPDLPTTGVDVPLDGVRPDALPGRLLALDAPIAVHGAPGVSAERLFAVRDAAVRALDALEVRFGFPEPAPDGVRGGGPELDLYVAPGGADVDCVVDALEYGALWDRASAFVRVRADLIGDRLERSVAEGIAQAILLGIDAHAPRPWRIALATTLAAQATALGPDLDAYRVFQRHPDAPLIRDRDDASARGASMFTNFLAEHYDAPDLRLLRGIAWMPVVATPPDRFRLASFPSFFDVLERSARREPGALEGVLAEFAVARALLGSDADAVGLSGGRMDPTLAPEWLAVLHFASLPGWVEPRPLLDETGTAYVLIDTFDAHSAPVNLWFHGVPWRDWKVWVLRIDNAWRLAGRVSDAPVQRGEWSTVVENLDRVAHLLVVISDFGNGNLDPSEMPSRQGWFVLHASR